MRIAGFFALAASVFLCAVSGLVLGPSCAPADALDSLPRLERGLDFEGGVALTYELDVPEGVDRDVATEQALEVLRERLDALGSPASVVRAGDSIRMEIPGTDAETLERTRGVVGMSSTLELRVVDDLSNVLDAVDALPPGVTRETESVTDFRDPMGGGVISTSYLLAHGAAGRAQLERIVATIPAGDREILLGRHEVYDDPGTVGSDAAWRTYVVERRVHVDGTMVADAFVAMDEVAGRPNVMVVLDDAGSAAFAQMTTDAVKRRIAIIVDGEVISAPLVQEPITGGRAQITLGPYMTYDELLREANDLVIMLRAGSLPAPLVLADETVVHAAYGEPMLAWLAIGAFLLLLVVVGAGALRYRAGTLALATPLLVAIPGLAVLALFGGVLTLYGVAGIGVGPVVGLIAGIVVAERLRRSGAAGAGVGATIADAGTAPALLLLLGIAGAILAAVVSGPTRGFATGLFVTCFAGILPSLLWLGGLSAARRGARRA